MTTCQAKIQDMFGNKEKCPKTAIKTVTSTVLTQKTIIKHLCAKHRKRRISKLRYEIKHQYRDIIIEEEDI